MKGRLLSALLFAGFAISLPLAAHHSFNAEYDANQPVKVTGVVTKVEWLNPHIWFYVDEKDASGNVTHWAFSGGAPGQLMRRGIMKDVIQPGMTVVVEGFRAKDGSNNANGTKVTFPDGKMVFTASGEEPGQGGGKGEGKK
jgi:DNA/RNA endonuclease YhcR with UshA esterase domain